TPALTRTRLRVTSIGYNKQLYSIAHIAQPSWPPTPLRLLRQGGTMETRSVGSSGFRVTSFGIGTASFGAGTSQDAAFETLDAAFAAGIRLIDTSDSYPSDPGLLGEAERIVGAWLTSRGVRDEMVIATKVNYPMKPGLNSRGLSRRHLMSAV